MPSAGACRQQEVFVCASGLLKASCAPPLPHLPSRRYASVGSGKVLDETAQSSVHYRKVGSSY